MKIIAVFNKNNELERTFTTRETTLAFIRSLLNNKTSHIDINDGYLILGNPSGLMEYEFVEMELDSLKPCKNITESLLDDVMEILTN